MRRDLKGRIGRPRKQRHTSKRIFERLRDEYGYSGGITIVKDYVLARRLRHREVFVPLRHDPGRAQVDFGEALAEIAGVERKIHFFAVDLPHSDACFVQAYPQLAPLYPKLLEFRELARSYDPGGKFRNEFLDVHVFG